MDNSSIKEGIFDYKIDFNNTFKRKNMTNYEVAEIIYNIINKYSSNVLGDIRQGGADPALSERTIASWDLLKVINPQTGNNNNHVRFCIIIEYFTLNGVESELQKMLNFKVKFRHEPESTTRPAYLLVIHR